MDQHIMDLMIVHIHINQEQHQFIREVSNGLNIYLLNKDILIMFQKQKSNIDL